MSNIKDISLAESGAKKIAWVASYMPILNEIRREFERTRPFEGLRISMSIHMEAKTAYLAQVLALGGASVCAAGCNPLSTQGRRGGGALSHRRCRGLRPPRSERRGV